MGGELEATVRADFGLSALACVYLISFAKVYNRRDAPANMGGDGAKSW